MRFSVHNDGDADRHLVEPEVVIGGPKLADDHINLKADSGRVYAVTKTKFSSQANPGTLLHRRTAAGSWSHVTVSTGFARPDAANRPPRPGTQQNPRLRGRRTARST